jgi:Na+-translocating ferredoxin:NAD+ oxidoreductase RnfG subunit
MPASAMCFSSVATVLFLLCAGTVFGQSRPQLEEAAGSIFGADCTLHELGLSIDNAESSALSAANGARHHWDKVSVYRIEKGRRTVGVFMVDNVKGKSRPITYAVAFDANGGILGLEILVYRESHGGEVASAVFRRQFEGKKRGDAFTVGRDIRNISGATISTRSVSAGTRALATLRHYLHEKGMLE